MPSPADQITIARHALQLMQRHALDSQPATCCGLVGGVGNAIKVAAPTRNRAVDTHLQCLPDHSDVTRILKEWRQRGLCGGAYCSSLAAIGAQPGMFANLFADLRAAAPSAYSNADSLLCLAINLGTDGRLETHAFRQQRGAWREIALVLEEDGRAGARSVNDT